MSGGEGQLGKRLYNAIVHSSSSQTAPKEIREVTKTGHEKEKKNQQLKSGS
jgi:hypothetical protein